MEEEEEGGRLKGEVKNGADWDRKVKVFACIQALLSATRHYGGQNLISGSTSL